MDNASSVHTAPPPVAPPPPPIAPPAPPISFKGRATVKKDDKPSAAAAAKKDSEQQKQLVVTLSDIQNVQLKNVTTTNKVSAVIYTVSLYGFILIMYLLDYTVVSCDLHCIYTNV